MASTEVVLGRTYRAYEQALEVIKERAPQGRREILAEVTFRGIPGPHGPNGQEGVQEFQAQLIAGLAEIVQEQNRRISELEEAATTKRAKKA